MIRRLRFLVVASFLLNNSPVDSAEALPIWPEQPPGETTSLPPEQDTTGPDGRLVAGRSVIRLGNVSTPTIEVFRPEEGTDTGAAIVICPGGGHQILAYDLEGTEVAEWLQSIGVTGIVLKYRVPARDPNRRWTAAVQDAQRAISVVRSRAESWRIDPDRIGILGFSAGGQTAALTSVRTAREYEAVDAADESSHRPNFAALVYPAYLTDRKLRQTLLPDVTVDGNSPPMFLVHAYNDPIPVENSVLMYLALRKANVPAELHAYAQGGHGFGMRRTDEPSSRWTDAFQMWLKRQGYLKSN